jgi:hypothetical protein
MELNRSYIGVGKVNVRTYGVTTGRRFVGNVGRVDLGHTLDIKKQPDFTRPGGGTAAQVERIQALAAAMQWLSFSPKNLAIAAAGALSAVAGATVSDELVKGYEGMTMTLAHPPASITSVTNVGATITYAAGTDYEKSGAGLYFPDGTTIVEAADLEVTYTYIDYSNIEGMMATGVELEILVEGLNEADSNKQVIVEMWRARFSPAQTIALIGQDFGSIDLTPELLKDPTKGSGVSAYYRVRAVD